MNMSWKEDASASKFSAAEIHSYVTEALRPKAFIYIYFSQLRSTQTFQIAQKWIDVKPQIRMGTLKDEEASHLHLQVWCEWSSDRLMINTDGPKYLHYDPFSSLLPTNKRNTPNVREKIMLPQTSRGIGSTMRDKVLLHTFFCAPR